MYGRSFVNFGVIFTFFHDGIANSASRDLDDLISVFDF